MRDEHSLPGTFHSEGDGWGLHTPDILKVPIISVPGNGAQAALIRGQHQGAAEGQLPQKQSYGLTNTERVHCQGWGSYRS